MEGFTLLKHGNPQERKPDPNLISPGSTTSQHKPSKPYKHPNGSVPLVSDSFDLMNFIKSKLSENEKIKNVIGIIGLQGSGKSTLLSMLAGNKPQDQFRQYIFRPATKDTTESGYYQTNGINVYINDARNVYIDCRPFNSGTILEEYNKRNRQDGKNQFKMFQADDLTLVSTMLDICHTVILSIDWFIDMNMIQELLRASLYSEFNSRKFAGYPKRTNLIVVHQRAQPTDFEVEMVKERIQILKSMFHDSRINIYGGVSMKKLGFERYNGCDEDVNYVLLDEFPLWNKDCFVEVDVHKIPFSVVVDKLKEAILTLPRYPFRLISHQRVLRLRPEEVYGKTRIRSRDKRPNFNDKDDTHETQFQPDHLPNITLKQNEPPPAEPWNDLDSILALTPASSVDSAAEIVRLLHLTTKNIKNEDFEGGLLPSEDKEMTEVDWFNYAGRVFKNHLDYYHNKYFLSNNGRLAPILLHKLKGSTRIVYKKERIQGRNERRGHRYQKQRTISEDKEEAPEEDNKTTSEVDEVESDHSSELSFTESSEDDSDSEEEEKRSKKYQRRRAASDSS